MAKNKLRPDDLTQADINQITIEIREQTADPNDARRLLEQFCTLYDLWGSEEFKPDQARKFEILLRHVSDSLHDYLTGNRKTLEAALGLKRKKARPKADPKIRIEMATEVLRLRLFEKNTYEEARERVSRKFGWVESIISEAWRAHKQDALICLRLERALENYPWTPDEVKRLTKIIGKEPWFISPEKSAIKPD